MHEFTSEGESGTIRVPHPLVCKGAGFPYAQLFAALLQSRECPLATFSGYRRRPLLGARQARDSFVRVLDQVRVRFKFRLVGYVVMPERVPHPSFEALRRRPKKQAGQLRLALVDHREDPAHFLQSWLQVWSAKRLREQLEYMNPVKRKLVLYPKEWPWSGWSHYEKQERKPDRPRIQRSKFKGKVRTLENRRCATLNGYVPQKCAPPAGKGLHKL